MGRRVSSDQRRLSSLARPGEDYFKKRRVIESDTAKGPIDTQGRDAQASRDEQLIGAGPFALGSILVGAQQAAVVESEPTEDRPFAELPLTISGPVEVAGVPTPQQMMRIVEGQPFVVPNGKIFVATGIGADQILFSGKFDLRIHSTIVAEAELPRGSVPSASILPVPPGIAAHAADTVDVVEPNATGVVGIALGYLADA